MNHKNLIKIGLACLILCFIGICLTGTTMGALDENDTEHIQDGAINYDYKAIVTDHIGNITAPYGMAYMTVDIFINNWSDKAVPLDPYHYILKSDGIVYPYDSATFDNSIASSNGYVLAGETGETQVVYKVKDSSYDFRIVFVDFPKVPLHHKNAHLPDLKYISPNAYSIKGY